VNKLFPHNNSSSTSWKNSKNNNTNNSSNNTNAKPVEFGEFNLQESLSESEKKPISGIRIHSSSYPKANSHHELRDRRTSLPNIFRNNNNGNSSSSNNNTSNSNNNSNANSNKTNPTNNTDSNPSNASSKPWRDSNSKQLSHQNQQQLHQLQQQQLQYHHHQQQLQQLQQKLQPQSLSQKNQPTLQQPQPEVTSPRGNNTNSTNNNGNFQRTLPLNDLKLMNRRRIQSMPTSAEKQEQLKEKYQHLEKSSENIVQSQPPLADIPLLQSQPQQAQQSLLLLTQEEGEELLIDRMCAQAVEPQNKTDLPHIRHSYPKSLREQELQRAPSSDSVLPPQPSSNNLSPREKNKQSKPNNNNNKSKPVSPRQKQVSPSIMKFAESLSPRNVDSNNRENDSCARTISHAPNLNGSDANLVADYSSEVANSLSLSPEEKHSDSQNLNRNNDRPSHSSEPNAAGREIIKEILPPNTSDAKLVTKPVPQPLNATTKRKNFQNFQQPKREKPREDSTFVCSRLITPANVLISLSFVVVSISMGYWFV
jgi:hypothetical protein